MEDKIKYKVISLLEQDTPPRDISDQLDVSYSSVIRVRGELERAKENGTISQLIDSDKLLLEKVGEELGLQESADTLAKGMDGLERLSTELQKTALMLNTRINSLLMAVEHPSELQVYASVLCDLQKAFINTNAVQVNVQNNIGNDNAPKYTQFLSDKPGGH